MAAHAPAKVRASSAWVSPPGAQSAAAFWLSVKGDAKLAGIVGRLLDDPRMRNVWDKIERQWRKWKDAPQTFERSPIYGPALKGVEGLHYQIFNAAVSHAMSGPWLMSNAEYIDRAAPRRAQANRFRGEAAELREAGLVFGGLAQNLEWIAADLDRWCEKADELRSISSVLIQRDTGQSDQRIFALNMADELRKLCGGPFYKIVTDLVGVVFNKPDPDFVRVREWCRPRRDKTR